MKIKAIHAVFPTVLGVIIILSYLNIATGVVDLPDKLVLMLAFAIGPVAIFGITELCRTLKGHSEGAALRVGTIFLVIGFALLNLMIVVQQTMFIMMEKYISDATDAVAAESMRLVFQGLNLVQIGIDISFDIFYSLGLIMLASVMYNHPRYGKILGVFVEFAAGKRQYSSGG